VGDGATAVPGWRWHPVSLPQAYNALIPTPGELSATLFIELTDEDALREWLPRLVGIERSLELRIGDTSGGGDGEGTTGVGVVHSIPEAAHELVLTRQTMTAAVHYIRFALSPQQVGRFDAGPVMLAAAHPEYHEETVLNDDTRRELLSDLLP
jgi:hypothetical protein